jgi:hypothetical protein
MVCDGPHGLRKQNPNGKKVGLGNHIRSLLPDSVHHRLLLDTNLIYEMGRALARNA